MEGESLYDILGVSRRAETEDIQKAYYRMVRRYRPNEHPDIFRKLNEAREVLSDYRRRGAYDQERASGAQVRALADQAALLADKDPQKALALLKNAVALAPDMARPRVLLAHTLMRLREYELAERQYRWLLKEAPTDETLHCRLARCLWLLERDHEALQETRRALELNPAFHEALLLQACLHRQSGEQAAVNATLEQAIANDGVEDFADFPALLQLLHFAVQGGDPAAEAYAERLRGVVTPDRVEEACAALARHGEGLLRQGQYAAVRALLEVAAKHPIDIGPVADLRARATLGDDTERLVQDKLVGGGLAACLHAFYLERGNAAIREAKLDEGLRLLQEELRADPFGLSRRIDYLRNEYPQLAAAQAALLTQIQEKARQANLMAAPPAYLPPPAPAPAPPTTPAASESHPEKRGFLDRLRLKRTA